MKLWLVRHAQPLVGRGTCYGATDVSADEQATATQSGELAQLLPQGLRIVSSPLQRCQSLYLTLCGLRPDLVLETDARLRELDFGSWEGRLWRDIPRAEFDAWMADFSGHCVGGGESVGALMKRVALALEDTRRCVGAQGKIADGTAVWITHAGVIRSAMLLARGVFDVRSAGEWPPDAPGYGQWHELALDDPRP
jgi:alpha-ribazole phosphatase